MVACLEINNNKVETKDEDIKTSTPLGSNAVEYPNNLNYKGKSEQTIFIIIFDKFVIFQK